MGDFSDQEIFQFFLNSGVHGRPWPDGVFCVAEVDGDGEIETLVERNENGCHAEENLISRLEDMMADGTLPSQDLCWFLNYSPCSQCSEAIIAFLREAEHRYGLDLDLKIRFAAMYKIRRPSCESGQHTHSHNLPTFAEHAQNARGLRRLQEHGVSLSAFEEDDWVYLAGLLGGKLTAERAREREDEDSQLQEDFESVMSSLVQEDYESTDDEEEDSEETDEEDGDSEYESDDDDYDDENDDGETEGSSDDDEDDESDEEEDGESDYSYDGNGDVWGEEDDDEEVRVAATGYDIWNEEDDDDDDDDDDEVDYYWQ